MYEFLIKNDKGLFTPAVEEPITWSTERKNSPGQLDFTAIYDKDFPIEEGNPVRLKYKGQKVFYGFIFKIKGDKGKRLKITAYDQLRYLKNKDTYVYENKKASELIKMLADDFNLQTGSLADTGFKIKSRVESNKTLFDIIQTALDLTLESKNKMYVLYDDFGKITLKSLADMKVNILIDEETGENYDYTSSIDESTYNKIKLIYDDEKSKKREVYIAKDSSNINKWGVLQYFDKVEKGEDGKKKADSLLNLYNHKTKNLSLKNIFGDVRVRAGSMIIVKLNLGDVKLSNYMLVEKCKHEFRESSHLMTLTMRGGEFIA